METARQCSMLISENKNMIIAEWEQEVRTEIIPARMCDSHMLQNHIPQLLDDIAAILIEKQSQGVDPRIDDYSRTLDKNQFHGKLRAETENYTVDQVILEYLILHRIVSEWLERHQVFSINIANLLKYIIERTIMQASAAFSESMQEAQDKVNGTLAHDLRNSLTVALSSTQLMARQPELHHRLTELTEKSLLRSINLTEELLDNISLKAGRGILMNFSEADYAKVLQDICDEYAAIYGDQLICKVPDNPVKGIFDPVAIRRLLDNLISNALKYGDPYSPVIIDFEEGDKEMNFLINNQGKPIPQEKQRSIFNFMNHNDDATTGKSWGVGLTLVKAIAEAHEGFIDISSDQENGTTFRITLKKYLRHPGKTRVKFSRD